MTREQALQKAEERVYCYFTAPTIARVSESLGFKVKVSKAGKLLNRAELEDKLIEYYTNLFMECL